MKKMLTALIVLALASGLMIEAAYAARLGGGRSMGTQRLAPMQRRALPPAAAPQQAKPAAPAAQPAQPAGNRWLGPLAGLAAGLGLGWLLGQGGAGAFGGVLLMALLAIAAVALLSRLFAKGRDQPVRRMSYADFGGSETAAAPPEQAPLPGSIPGATVEAMREPKIPAGFDAAAFLEHAKRNFLQLQEANDRADLAELREVTTGAMFESLKEDAAARGARQQQTEVIALNAELLEVATEADRHWASVRFSGSVREAPSAAPEPFDEVWNLQKPVNGQSGWLLAGIQQPGADR
ncbi:MAG: Tim44 domain-containing protein [Betaproteobacteria bacterium]|nr:Tim44 domain-containing protein [Betaproteobacteria bacterium]